MSQTLIGNVTMITMTALKVDNGRARPKPARRGEGAPKEKICDGVVNPRGSSAAFLDQSTIY